MSIYDNTVAMSLSVGSFGNSAKVDKETLREVMPAVSDVAIEEYLKTTRKLISGDEFKAIKSRDSEFYLWFKKQTVPSYFRKGISLIPQQHVSYVAQKLAEYKAEREELVEALGLVWEARWHESQAETAEKFGYLECPPWDRVQSRFYVRHGYLALTVPGNLQIVSQQVYDQEVAAMQSRLREVEQAITAMLRQEVVDLTRHLVSRLRGLDDGTTRRFASSSIGNLEEWCRLFLDGRNVCNDEELKQVVENLSAVIMQSDDVELLKSHEQFRASVIGNLEQCIKEVELQLEAAPTRALELE